MNAVAATAMIDETRQLIERAQGGDPEALSRVFEVYRDRIHALVRKKLGDPLRRNLDSSDVVQSVCLEALQDIDKVEYRDEDGFVRWLARIAENTIRDRHRYFGARKRRGPGRADDLPLSQADAEAQGLTPSRELSNAEQMALVLDALGRLPEEYRRVIRLVRFEKKSHAEAGEALGRSEKATRMLLARARARLARELGASLDEE
ncbi:MAG: sigma-70 family RNA polymerase sigma factor [Planctomycetota bacterium]